MPHAGLHNYLTFLEHIDLFQWTFESLVLCSQNASRITISCIVPKISPEKLLQSSQISTMLIINFLIELS